MKTKAEKIKLIRETINYYRKNQRAVLRGPSSGTMCAYITPEGHRCAIGRLLPAELCAVLENSKGFKGVGDVPIWHRLPADLQDYDRPFLVLLQRLHDTAAYWRESNHQHLANALSAKGVRYAREIVKWVRKGL